jgi:hypothetical protein
MLGSGNLNMPWFGAKKGNSFLMVHVKNSSNCQLHLVGNKLVKPDGFGTVNRRAHIEGERLSSLSMLRCQAWNFAKTRYGI